MLYRKIASLIEAHLQSDSNKILLIDGARQVGKTYIVRYVGQKLFENYIEINLVEDALGAGLFANVRTVEDFYLRTRVRDDGNSRYIRRVGSLMLAFLVGQLATNSRVDVS